MLTQSEPRFINQLLAGPFSAGDANFGGNFWVIPYSNIRGANLLLHALDNPALIGLTDAQKEATRGFAKTIQALDYLQVLDAHDVNGVVLLPLHPLRLVWLAGHDAVLRGWAAQLVGGNRGGRPWDFHSASGPSTNQAPFSESDVIGGPPRSGPTLTFDAYYGR